MYRLNKPLCISNNKTVIPIFPNLNFPPNYTVTIKDATAFNKQGLCPLLIEKNIFVIFLFQEVNDKICSITHMMFIKVLLGELDNVKMIEKEIILSFFSGEEKQKLSNEFNNLLPTDYEAMNMGDCLLKYFKQCFFSDNAITYASDRITQKIFKL